MFYCLLVRVAQPYPTQLGHLEPAGAHYSSAGAPSNWFLLLSSFSLSHLSLSFVYESLSSPSPLIYFFISCFSLLVYLSLAYPLVVYPGFVYSILALCLLCLFGFVFPSWSILALICPPWLSFSSFVSILYRCLF
jgi:hypothetical protein